MKKPLRYRGASDASIARLHSRARPVTSLLTDSPARFVLWSAHHRRLSTVLSGFAWAAAVAIGTVVGGESVKVTLLAAASVFTLVVACVVAAPFLTGRQVIPVLFGLRLGPSRGGHAARLDAQDVLASDGASSGDGAWDAGGGNGGDG